MNIESIESVIRNPAHTDDEVFAIVIEMISDADIEPIVSQEELNNIYRLSELLLEHRPNVMERIRQKANADHGDCCGPSAQTTSPTDGYCGGNCKGGACCGGNCDCNKSE